MNVTTQKQEKDPIIARIERLERQNRRQKQGALVCLLGLVSIGVVSGLNGQAQQTQTSQTQTSKTQTTQRKTTKKPAPKAAPPPAPEPAAPAIPEKLEAESFVLVDQAGHERAELAMGGTGPSFRLLNQSGSALVTISLNDGAPGGPMLLLSDPAHHASLTMSALESAGSQLTLMGDNQDAKVHMSVTKDGTALELFDQDGFSTSVGNGVKVSKSGKAQQTSAASIALYNKDRKVLWSAP